METSSTTMNWAATMSASAVQGFGRRGRIIEEPDIYLPSLSWNSTTISYRHDRMRYTSLMTAQPSAIPVKAAEKTGAKPPYELICSTAHLLKRLGMELKEAYRGAFEAAGASPFHYSVLAVLEESPRETQATIADSLRYDRSWLLGLLHQREAPAPIAPQRDPAAPPPPPPRARRGASGGRRCAAP